MIEKKTLKTEFSKCFIDSGYIKRGQTWYLDDKEIIFVVNLQKSNWGDFYYFNISFYIKALGDQEFPSHNNCHLQFRAEDLFPGREGLIFNGLSLEEGNQESLYELVLVIKDEIIPTLSQCTEIIGIQRFLSNGKQNKGLIYKTAREFLFGV